MNVRWQDVHKTATRIVKELEALEAKINEALTRHESTLESVNYGPVRTHSTKFAKLRQRVRDANTHLKDGIQ